MLLIYTSLAGDAYQDCDVTGGSVRAVGVAVSADGFAGCTPDRGRANVTIVPLPASDWMPT